MSRATGSLDTDFFLSLSDREIFSLTISPLTTHQSTYTFPHMTTTAKKAAPAYDENLIVEDLLKLHAATIAEVKTLCAAELALQDSDDYRTKHPAAYVYDDLALLRYVLSYKKASAVKKPLAQGIAYREASPWLADPKNPAAAQISEFLCSGLHGSLRDGSPFQIIRAGVSNPPAVVKSVPFDEVSNHADDKRAVLTHTILLCLAISS